MTSTNTPVAIPMTDTLADSVQLETSSLDRRKSRKQVRNDRRRNSSVAIGLEVSPEGVALAFIRPASPGQPASVQTDCVKFPADSGPAKDDWSCDTLSKALTKLVDKYRLSGQAVSVAIGGSPCVTRAWFGENANVDANISELRQRTDRYLALGRGEKVSTYFEKSTDAKRKRAWVTVAHRQVVQSIANAVQASGLRLTKIEHGLVAICRALGKARLDASEPVMLLRQSQGRPEIGVSYAGQLLLDYRPAKVSLQLHLDADQVMARVIDKQIKCVRRYLQVQLPRNSKDLQTVYFPSAASLEKDVAAEMQEEHGLAPSPLPSEPICKSLGIASSEITTWESLAALCIAAPIQVGSDDTADLMDSLRNNASVSTGTIVKLFWPVAATILLLLGAHVTAWLESSKLMASSETLESLQPSRMEYARLQRDLMKQNSQIENIELLANSVTQANWSSIVKFAGRALPEGAWLSQVHVARERSVILTGASFTNDAIYEYVERLRASKLFTPVTLDGTKNVRIDNGPAYEFEISATAFDGFETDAESVANSTIALRL